MPVHLITEPEETSKSINYREIKVPESSRRLELSRSQSLDRSSRIGSREIEGRSSRNLKIERLSRSRTHESDNESVNRPRESRFRTNTESRNARNLHDRATRLSRSQDLSNRAIMHLDRRSLERRNSPNLRLRTNDRRSPSTERRGPSEIVRQESRDLLAGRRENRDLTRNRVDRSETRERRLRSVERRDVESLPKARSGNLARGDIDRNNNLNRRNRERSLETRRVLLDRVTNQERRSRVSIVARNSRQDLARSNDRRLQSRSEHINDFDRETLHRRVRSVESNTERSGKRRLSSERRSLARSTEMNRIEHRGVENLAGQRSLDRTTSRVSSEDVRRGRLNRSRRILSQRDSRENDARENSRIPSRSLYDFEDTSNRERRERHVRSSRSVDRNSMYRRDLAKIRESRDRGSRDSSTEQRDLSLERRERANRAYRSREQMEREFRRTPERRVLERRDTSRRLSERKIDEIARSQASRMIDRRLERNQELRISRGRILEKRSTVNSRKSLERRIDDRSREGSRMQNRRERNSELRDTISMRMMDRRANRAAHERRTLRSLEKRADVRRDRQFRSLEERRVSRSVENRLAKSPEEDSDRQLHRRSLNLNVKDSSRLTSLRRVIRTSEQNREQRTLSAARMISRIASNDRLFAKWEQKDASVDKIEAKIAPKSMDYGFFKYPMAYDFMRQAFVVALCTVYGLSLYNGKKTFIG